MKKYAIFTAILCMGLATSPAYAQADPLRNIRGLADSIKQLGQIGKKPKVETAAASNAATPNQSSMINDAPGADQTQVAEGSSNLASAAIVKRNPATFDVGGIKLGMAPAEVIRIAKEKRFKVYDWSKGNQSFDRAVANKALYMQGKPTNFVYTETSFLRLSDDQGSVWAVHFHVTRNGPKVYIIDYETPLNGRTKDVFMTALTAKYGAPEQSDFSGPGNYGKASWCAPTEPCRLGKRTLPTAYVSVTDRAMGLKLELNYAGVIAAENDIENQAKANLAKTAPKTTF